MSPLRRKRTGGSGGAPIVTVARVVASALLLFVALLLVRASATATTRRGASEACVGPVPVGGACSTSSSSSTTRTTTSSSTTTQSTSTTGSETETTTTTTEETTTEGEGGTTETTTTTSTRSGARSSPTAAPAQPFPTPPPPLPPPSPGVAPESAVQRIVMVPAISGQVAPGDTVDIQATMEAQRGTEIYAVPGVPVTFTIVSAPGGGATVTPARVTSSPSGVAVAHVRTAGLPGDTVVSASSGTASAQLTVHTDAPVATGAAAHVTPPSTSGAGGGSEGHRLALVGLLAGLGVAGAVTLGVVRRPHHG